METDVGGAVSTVSATMHKLDLRRVEHGPLRGPHVWKLQAMLNAWLCSADGPVPPNLLMTDGAAGVLTRAVLLDFQTAQQVTADAVVGPLTWRALFEFDVVTAD